MPLPLEKIGMLFKPGRLGALGSTAGLLTVLHMLIVLGAFLSVFVVGVFSGSASFTERLESGQFNSSFLQSF